MGNGARQRIFLIRDGHDRSMSPINHQASFGSPPFYIDADVHRRGSVSIVDQHCDCDCHNGRQTSAATNTSNPNRRIVGADPTLLGSGSPLTPKGLVNLAGSSRPVSFSPIPTIIHCLTWSFSCVQRGPGLKAPG